MYMAYEERNAPPRGAVWLVALVIMATVVATRALWFGNPAATTDEQLYALIGAELAQGRLPYLELWDRKPFGLFAIFAMGHWIAPGPVGFQIIAGLFTLVGAWLTYLLARSQVDWLSSSGAAVLYVILISLYGGFSGQSEVFHAPMMLAMAWLVLDTNALHYSRRTAIAMLVGGLALQVKYTVLPQCLFFGAVALWQLYRHGFLIPRLFAMGALFVGLGIAPTFAVGLLYASAGHFDSFWFANFESFFLRGNAGRFMAPVLIGLLPLVCLGLAGVYLAFRGKPLRNPAMYTLFLGWSLAAFASSFLPGTVYLYYFGGLVGPVILVALPLLDRNGPLKAAPLVLVLLATSWLLGPLEDWETSREETASLNALAMRIQPFVNGHQSCLWVHDGPTALYTMADSCLPSRFIYPDHLNNALETDAALGLSQTGEALRILEGKPPVIVTSEEPLTHQNAAVITAVRTALANDYRELATARSGYREVKAYVRKELVL